MKRKPRRPAQLSLPLSTWGGARIGAGRKPASARANTPHRTRPEHKAAHPLHVTLRAGLRPLRSQHVFPAIRRALSQATRCSPSFRIVHYSVQVDHIHLVIEAADKASLSRGLRGLVIRIARQVNRLLMRKGSFWADCWHARALTSPRQVRNALVYVLCNFRKHTRTASAGVDTFSSASDSTRCAGEPLCYSESVLLLDDDDELSVQPDEEESRLAAELGDDGLRAVDESLRKHTKSSWLKVARVVADAMTAGGFRLSEDGPVDLHVRRLMGLVDAGVIEAQGNMRRPRWSEVRNYS